VIGGDVPTRLIVAVIVAVRVAPVKELSDALLKCSLIDAS
jgi:hypothetical protein